MTRRNPPHHRHPADGAPAGGRFPLAAALALGIMMPRAALADTIGEFLAVDVTTPVARATRALAADDAEAALVALEAYAGPTPSYVTHIRALAHWKLGQPEKARALWNSVAFSTCEAAGPSALEALVRRTRAALVAPTDPQTAADQLMALPDDAVRWTQAIELYRRAANDAATQRLTDRLLLRFPAFPEALAIAEGLGPEVVEARLGTLDRRLERLRALMDGNANAQAALESQRLLEALDQAAPQRCEVLYIQGVTARKRRRYQEAMKILRQARIGCLGEPHDFAVRAALVQTRVAAILGRIDDTQYLVDWMAEKFPDHSFNDDARFLLAEVLERKNRTDQARKQYQKIADTAAADHASMAEWRLAWALLRAGKSNEARARLERIQAMRVPRPQEHARAHYWLGRIDEAKHADRAVERYEGLIARPSFYGWLALHRLRAVRPKAAKKAEQGLLAAATSTAGYVLDPAVLARPELVETQEYARAGDSDLAAWSVRRLACGAPTPGTKVLIALALDAVGAQADAQRLLRADASILAGPLSPANAYLWRAAYSRAYRDEIDAAAAATDIDALLLTALVREESTFDPDIVSWAGATGLAQLMPATAIGAYRQVYRARLDLRRLTEPALNVRLGAQVLREGIRGFDHPTLALGAYNGGRGLVRRYLSRRPEPFEDWIEDFGVKETRRYMKRVTETWGVYRLLYGEKTRFIQLPARVAR